MKKYYAMETTENSADIIIFGDITSWPWLESDVSAYMLSNQILGLDVDTINVHINSYGGEVAEGIAIYNSLKQHKAKIRTYCDGFAASIASAIFMAGDERVMSNASALMIHNAWSRARGNANDFRKVAEDLDKINQLSINAYMEHVTITEEKLKQLMNEETWLLPQEALDYGFATSITGEEPQAKYSQSVRKELLQRIAQRQSGNAPAQKTLMNLFKGVARKEG